MNLSSMIFNFLKLCFKEDMPHVKVTKPQKLGDMVQGYVELKGEQYLVQIRKANTIKSKNRIESYF